MLRSVVYTALLDVMPVEFGRLESAPRDLVGPVITDACDMVTRERFPNIYEGVQEYARRRELDDSAPGYLTRYAESLARVGR